MKSTEEEDMAGTEEVIERFRGAIRGLLNAGDFTRSLEEEEAEFRELVARFTSELRESIAENLHEQYVGLCASGASPQDALMAVTFNSLADILTGVAAKAVLEAEV